MTKRIDVLLVERNLAPSRQKAQTLIAGGAVFVDGVMVKKPSELFEETREINITQELRYVGRGGFKLEKALTAFQIDLRGLVCGDIGASTGGFTDCMLQNGAKKVYAIDSGHGQLNPFLANHPDVVNLEGCNIRDFSTDSVEPFDFSATDLSFISLTLVFQPIRRLLKKGAGAVFLIKPQFEAGKNEVGKGVVQDPKVHLTVLNKILAAAGAADFQALGLEPSPILGGDGNIEFLLYTRAGFSQPEKNFDLYELVSRAQKQKKTIRKGGGPN